MNIKYVIARIRRRFQRRIRLREVARKAYWLQFENESILSFLAKYSIIRSGKGPIIHRQKKPHIQNYVSTSSRFTINFIES